MDAAPVRRPSGADLRRARRTVVARHALLIFAAALVATTLVLARPGGALGADPTPRGTSIDDQTYKGWGFVQTSEASTRVWEWSAAGWAPRTMGPGTSAWLHPWGDGWYWLWRDNKWHAIDSSRIGEWTCTGPYGQATQRAAAGAITMYRYNTTRSEVLGLADGAITRVCDNTFPDAAVDPDMRFIAAPTGLTLVEATVRPATCAAAGGAGCTAPAGGWPTRRAYVDECTLTFIGRSPACLFRG